MLCKSNKKIGSYVVFGDRFGTCVLLVNVRVKQIKVNGRIEEVYRFYRLKSLLFTTDLRVASEDGVFDSIRGIIK